MQTSKLSFSEMPVFSFFMIMLPLFCFVTNYCIELYRCFVQAIYFSVFNLVKSLVKCYTTVMDNKYKHLIIITKTKQHYFVIFTYRVSGGS